MTPCTEHVWEEVGAEWYGSAETPQYRRMYRCRVCKLTRKGEDDG